MKNWKYIEGAKVGNETLAAHPDSLVAQEIYKVYLDAGKDENKALEMLASKYKNLPKEALKKHLKDAIKAYANIVRNSKASNIAADITTDGNTWFVTTSDGKKKEFPSEREAEAYVKKIKTGNETLGQFITQKPKAVNEDKTGAEEFFKKLSDDVKEREEKDDADIEKVGNREIYVNQSEQTKAVVYDDGTIMLWDKNGNNYKTIKAGSLEEARKKLNSDYKKVGNALNWDENLVGKFVWVKDKGQEWKVYVMQDKGDKVYIRDDEDGSQGWVSKTRITGKVGNSKEWDVKDSDVIEYIYGDPNATKLQRICEKNLGTYDTSKVQALLVDEKSNKWAVVKRGTSAKMKVGNRVIEKESEMSQELKTLLKKAPEWIKEKIQYAFSHGFTIDEKDFINAIKKEVGNSKTGNAQWDRAYYKQMIDPAKWSEFEKKFEKLIYDQNLERYDMEDRMSLKPELRSDKYKMIERQRKDVEAMINKYRKAGNKTGKVIGNKTGNSASDDKFAYVMREFDEGKLKTPDGKVVTDPAQAKAIAYSESKKTENGLARARNAMNKRCGNSQVTLWKGNDSVLISEDGTVQYLESNSFETDRDKYGSMQEAIDDLTKKGYRKK